MSSHNITFTSDGAVRCLYTELIDLSSLGALEIVRASSIEFSNRAQRWTVRSVEGAVLFTDPSRQACLDWEQEHLNP
jgi:hypothetical protein